VDWQIQYLTPSHIGLEPNANYPKNPASIPYGVGVVFVSLVSGFRLGLIRMVPKGYSVSAFAATSLRATIYGGSFYLLFPLHFLKKGGLASPVFSSTP